MRNGHNIWTLANGVSLLRLILALPAGYLITSGEYVPALVVFLVAALSDGLDGYLARSRNEISKLGQLLDPVADKATGIAVFAALVLQGALPAWALWLLAAKEALLLVGGLFILGFGKRVIAARFLGKLTTVVLFTGFALILAGLSPLGQGVALAGVALSVAAGVDYAVQVTRMYRGHGNE